MMPSMKYEKELRAMLRTVIIGGIAGLVVGFALGTVVIKLWLVG